MDIRCIGPSVMGRKLYAKIVEVRNTHWSIVTYKLPNEETITITERYFRITFKISIKNTNRKVIKNPNLSRVIDQDLALDQGQIRDSQNFKSLLLLRIPQNKVLTRQN